MYDWANSAYSTLLITIVMSYLQEFVLPGGRGVVAYAWGIGAAMFLAAVLSPIVGALADANRSKRTWLGAMALTGAAAAVLMAVVPLGCPWLILLLFVVMNVAFELALVPYNGFLPEIADETTINRVSAWGFALGYAGGAVPLLAAGMLILWGPQLGLHDAPSQHRAGILLLGLWWGVFSLPALLVLRDRGRRPERPEPLLRAARSALREVGRTLASVRRYRVLALFLLAYLFYNDGIQTLITQATTLASREFAFSTLDLFYLVLAIQCAALPGALVVGRVADRVGQKATLLGCLLVWIALPIAAALTRQKWHIWMMGLALAAVMGGTQAVSRAVVGVLTPPPRAAEFFGFFNLSGKAGAWMGPALFGAIVAWSGNVRLACLGILVFFVVGWCLVARVHVGRGRQQAAETAAR
jgi:UMF1 family MFS transporter